MQGFQVSFNVYANSQEEADAASQAFKSFVNEQARQGVAVTAAKIVEAVNKYKNNIFVTNYFK
ncbi:MAG: hypothetical protein II636_04175 [Bacteroidales bacterium]|nr:hypothetical protein [Bacteroidales bacterium]